MFVFSNISDVKSPFLLVISFRTEKANELVFELLENELDSYKLKSKVYKGGNYDLTLEVKERVESAGLVNKIGKIANVNSVALLGYDGEFAV